MYRLMMRIRRNVRIIYGLDYVESIVHVSYTEIIYCVCIKINCLCPYAMYFM